MRFFSLFSIIICAREIFFVSLHAFWLRLRLATIRDHVAHKKVALSFASPKIRNFRGPQEKNISDFEFNIKNNTTMKKYFIIPALVAAFTMFSCKERAYIDAPGDNSHNQDSLPQMADPDPTPDPSGVEIPAGTLNVNEAVKIAKKLASGAVTEDRYFIKGWVVGFNRSDKFDTDFPKYGNDFVYIKARQDGQGEKQFYAYRVLSKFGAKLPDLECVKEGDFIVISCYMTNYSGIYESNGLCHIYSSNNEHFNEMFPWQFPGCPEPGEGEISVTGAEKVSAKLESKATSAETYKIRGVVTSIDTVDPSYGNATFNISDGSGVATCYRLKGKNNGKFTNANQVQVGDTVLVNAKIQNYNGTCEPTQGYVEESTNPNF